MNIVVVGGAGFIGSHLVDRLLADGHAVDVVDDLSSGSLGNLAEARTAGGTLRINTLDAASPALTDLVALRQPEVIYHLAAVVPGGSDPGSLAASSMATTVSVLEAARHVHGAKVVVALQGASLYGEVPSRDQPIKEGRGWAPADVRGVAAHAVLDLAQVYRDSFAVEYTALVAPCIYGSRQRADGGVVGAFASAIRANQAPTIMGDGRQIRDLLFIDDAVDALARAAQRGDGLVVNIGTGVGTSVRDLWAAAAAVGASFRPPSPDPLFVAERVTAPSRLTLASTRARIHLDWESWTDLAAGLAAVLGD